MSEYIAVLREESPLMAAVLQVENNDARPYQEKREKYNSWLFPAVRAMYAIDTVTDIFKDRNEGNMNVEISPRTLIELGNCALKDFGALIRISPASVYPAMIRRTATQTVEKIQRPNFWSKQLGTNQEVRRRTLPPS